MIEIKFENPEQQPLPFLSEFKNKITDLGLDFQKQEQSFTVTAKPGSLKEKTMGEPLSFSLIVDFVMTHQDGISALTKLAVFLKAVRDLYVSFQSKAKSSKDSVRSERLTLTAGENIIELPTKDEDIDNFVKNLKNN